MPPWGWCEPAFGVIGLGMGRQASHRDTPTPAARQSRPRHLWRALGSLTVFGLALAAVAYGLSLVPAPRAQLPARIGFAIADAGSWGYQLQGATPERMPDALDVLVIDLSRDGSDARTYTPANLDAFRRRGDGRSRILLAYLSIGEAEVYRSYWWPHWRQSAPVWLGKENKDWRGNFAVRYWHPDWQRLIVAPARSALDSLAERLQPWRTPYLDRILDAGFDGVYLDRVDAFEDAARRRPGAEAEMVRFVAAIAAHAKARRPGFLVVPQNGEELLAHADYRAVIDAVAKEDLLFGVNGEEIANSASDVVRSAEFLDRARAEGRPVFVVEYLASADKRLKAATEAARLGYILQFAHRDLNKTPEIAVPVAAPPFRPARAAPPIR